MAESTGHNRALLLSDEAFLWTWLDEHMLVMRLENAPEYAPGCTADS